MENDIFDSLSDLGLDSIVGNDDAFSEALDGGIKSLAYTKLVHVLAEQLKTMRNLEEHVSLMNDPDESSSFLLELSSFLKELGCPYRKLVTGHMSSRLQTRDDRVLLLDYLVSELVAARICAVDRPKEKPAGMQIVVLETPTAKSLKEILIALKFNKPPANITPEMLFSKVEAKLADTIQKEGAQLVGKPLYNKSLNDKEWKELENHFSEMYEEFQLRRETLITRLECTIQSFEWSERLRNKRDVVQSMYRPLREQMKVKPNVGLADFLAARTSLLQVEKTSSASVRKNTQSEVNKVIIGRVPDRGGRPNEQQPPPPEMPSWQQRSAPQGGGRGGGGRGGGRGFNAGGGGGGFNSGGGGFNSGGGGFNSGGGGFNSGGGGFNSGGGRGAGFGGGRGGRVQGSYNQGDARPQPTQPNIQGRSYQTFDVPPGGYGTAGYTQNYDSMGGYNQGVKSYQTPGYQTRNQGYQSRGGYQNEHDDRDNYNRGGGGQGRGTYHRGGRR